MAIDDPVQPPEGQGGESGGENPAWASYLDRIPSEARDAASEAFKEWDANTTRKFQEAAEYRDAWKPYEELGIKNQDPEFLQWGLQVAEAAANDPQEFYRWVNENYAKDHNLVEQQEEDPPYIDPDTQALVEKQLQAQLGPVAQQLAEMAEWKSSQEQAAREAEAQAFIESELDGLKDEDGFDRGKVEAFLGNHMDDPENAVRLAWEDYKTFRADIERSVLQGKADVPAGAESGGAVDSTVDLPTTMEKAREVARQMLRANNQA